MKSKKVLALKFFSPLAFGMLYYIFPAQFVNQAVFDSALFTAGGLLGHLILHLDENVFAEKYQEQGIQKRVLITRSILFMLVLIPLSIYLLTSTGSKLGIGLLLGLVTGLLIEMVIIRNDIDAFQMRFLSQLKNTATAQQIGMLVKGFGAFWSILLLSIFLVGNAFSGNAYQLPF